jgi:excisionase family DNA binding protein
MSSSPTAVSQSGPEPVARLLTIQQAAQYLSTTAWAIRSLLWAGEVPYLHIGRRFLIDRSDLDSFINRTKQRNGTA